MHPSPVAFKKQKVDDVCVHLIGNNGGSQISSTPEESSISSELPAKTHYILDYTQYHQVFNKPKPNGIKCNQWPWVLSYCPLFILLVSIIQIIVFTQSNSFLRSTLNFDPKHKEEAYRFLTYMLLHVNVFHLLLNVLIQVILGTPLELEQGHTRTALVYIGGGLGGALGSSVSEPNIVLEGASAGVYAILMAQISHIILNHAELRYKITRCIAVGILLMADITHAACHITSGNEYPRISISAHICGALSGILLGLVLFKGTSRWAKTYQILAGSIFLLLCSAAILRNVVQSQTKLTE